MHSLSRLVDFSLYIGNYIATVFSIAMFLQFFYRSLRYNIAFVHALVLFAEHENSIHVQHKLSMH